MDRKQAQNQEQLLTKMILVKLLRLNASVQGLVTGALSGVGIFLATNWLLITAKEGVPVGPHLSLLGQFFPGYSVSFRGSLIGIAYAFTIGFLVGYLVSVLYNFFVDLRQNRLVCARKSK